MNTTNQSSNTNLWVLSLYLSGLTGFIEIPFIHLLVPLLIWLLKNNEPEIDRHGRNVLNFNITYAVIEIVLMIVGRYLMPKTPEDLLSSIGQLPTGLVMVSYLATGFLWAFLGLLIVGGIKGYQGDFFRLPGQQKLFKGKGLC